MNELIFLIGPRASGKTTIGRGLAAAMGWGFVDTDLALTEAAQATVAEIVAREGWAGFRARESGILRSTAAPDRRVIATGGGMVLSLENRDFMRQRGRVYYLSVPVETLAARLTADPQSDQRPSLSGCSLVEEVAQVLREREPLYRGAAHVLVQADQPVADVIREMADDWRSIKS